MRIVAIFALLPFLWSLVVATTAIPNSEVYFVDSAESGLEPMSPTFSRLYDMLMEHFGLDLDNFDTAFDGFSKRDALEDTLTQLLESLRRSGVVLDALHEIADSPEQMNALANSIFLLAVSLQTGNSTAGISLQTNFSQIWSMVEDSGLIDLTLLGLLLDETQRNMLADNLGEVLVNYTWIGLLLYRVGDNGKLSMDIIFDAVRDYLSKDPGFNGTSYPQMKKRDDANSGQYEGSFQAFLSNLASSALNSQLASTLLESILRALNNSGVVVPAVQTLLGDQKILNMVGYICNKLYNYGVFDNIPLQEFFDDLKRKHQITQALEIAMTHPKWSPPLAMVFQRLEQEGAYEQIRRNLYGP